jgi:archaellum component FlaC
MADKTLELLLATVNDLTIAVHKGFNEMREEFQKINGRLEHLEDEVKLTRTELKILSQKYGEHEVSIESLKKAK